MNVESIVRDCLCKVLKRPPDQAERLDLKEHLMFGYGLTSLDLIVLMTSVCGAADVPLTEFTEQDISALQTPLDIVTLLGAKRSALEAT